MPAAAVTPAPIAYIKVVALKKLVVRLPRAPLLWRRPALGVSVDYALRASLLDPARPHMLEPFLPWSERVFSTGMFL